MLFHVLERAGFGFDGRTEARDFGGAELRAGAFDGMADTMRGGFIARCERRIELFDVFAYAGAEGSNRGAHEIGAEGGFQLVVQGFVEDAGVGGSGRGRGWKRRRGGPLRLERKTAGFDGLKQRRPMGRFGDDLIHARGDVGPALIFRETGGERDDGD